MTDKKEIRNKVCKNSQPTEPAQLTGCFIDKSRRHSQHVPQLTCSAPSQPALLLLSLLCSFSHSPHPPPSSTTHTNIPLPPSLSMNLDLDRSLTQAQPQSHQHIPVSYTHLTLPTKRIV